MLFASYVSANHFSEDSEEFKAKNPLLPRHMKSSSLIRVVSVVKCYVDSDLPSLLMAKLVVLSSCIVKLYLFKIFATSTVFCSGLFLFLLSDFTKS